MNYNQNSPGLFRLMHVMNHFGFDMFDITDLAYDIGNTEMLLQFDIIWVKRTSPIWNQKCTGYPQRGNSTN